MMRDSEDRLNRRQSGLQADDFDTLPLSYPQEGVFSLIVSPLCTYLHIDSERTLQLTEK